MVVIGTPTQMRNALNYVLRNDVHHGLGQGTLDPALHAFPKAPAVRTLPFYGPGLAACRRSRLEAHIRERPLALGTLFAPCEAPSMSRDSVSGTGGSDGRSKDGETRG